MVPVRVHHLDPMHLADLRDAIALHPVFPPRHVHRVDGNARGLERPDQRMLGNTRIEDRRDAGFMTRLLEAGREPQHHALEPPHRSGSGDVQDLQVRRFSTLEATSFPMASDAVAAGEGALITCRDPSPSTIWKSSSSFPSRSRACARTPLPAGTKS